MRIVGCDPGCGGALALLHDGLSCILDMPTFHVRRGKTDKAEVDAGALLDALLRWAPDVFVLEQVGGLPGQSAPAAFNFGRAVAAAEYTARAVGLRVELVAPVTWKKGMRLGPGKDEARAAACNLWPHKRDLFARVKDDGRAEAALIAEWFRRYRMEPSHDVLA
jgi:crossover junction endodeoxyribonuclease RuvC